jgi:hypothetical protein
MHKPEESTTVDLRLLKQIFEMSIHENIDTCAQIRSDAAEAICSMFLPEKISERKFCQNLQNELAKNPKLYPQGWYVPPPFGLAALFGAAEDGYERLKFDTLRKEQFWPRDDIVLDKNGTGIIYASPVDLETGIIGDFGITICLSNDQRIINHMHNCLHLLETAAEQAEIGMQFRELHELTQKLFAQNGLTNARTVTWTDKTGTNLGHTIPWSDEEATDLERQIIDSRDIKKLRQLISEKRINVNRIEPFRIKDNMAFTLEARLESKEYPLLPNVYYHLIVTCKDGKKTVLANFNKVFDFFGMAEIRSRYS